jgi:hypothetical protein
VPAGWLASGRSMSVTNFPTTEGPRISVTITAPGRSESLTVPGATAGPALFELPSFVGNVVATSSGQMEAAAGRVTLRPGRRRVTVQLRHALRT